VLGEAQPGLTEDVVALSGISRVTAIREKRVAADRSVEACALRVEVSELQFVCPIQLIVQPSRDLIRTHIA